MSRSCFCSVNQQNTHTFPALAHRLSHWNYAVSGARLMSHGGHFSSLLLHLLCVCMRSLRPACCICFFTHPSDHQPSCPTLFMLLLLSHLLLRFHFSTFLIAFPSPPSSPRSHSCTLISSCELLRSLLSYLLHVESASKRHFLLD